MEKIDKANVDKIGDLLISASHTIAVAESVTSGNIQAAFSLAKNATCFFQGGITVYNAGQKCRHFNVDPIHAGDCNCVSQQIADKMAIEVADLFCAEYGIGITGYASSIPQKGITQLFAHVAIAKKGMIIQSVRLDADTADPQSIQLFYTSEVLKLVLTMLTTKQNFVLDLVS